MMVQKQWEEMCCGERIQNTYERALEMIISYTGLEDLTLIEKVHLRNLATNSVQRLELVTELFSAFSPTNETIGIFLETFYDTPASHTKDLVFLAETRKRLLAERGYDALLNSINASKKKNTLLS